MSIRPVQAVLRKEEVVSVDENKSIGIVKPFTLLSGCVKGETQAAVQSLITTMLVCVTWANL